jgi:hypothetical protein
MKLLARLWKRFWTKVCRDDRTNDEWEGDQF